MLKVALTGGIATGKSYVRERIERQGVPTIDADRLARDAIAPESSGWKGVVARFGRELVGPDGEIDRRRLGDQVFADPAARRDLEAIVHPEVYEAIRRWFVDLEARGHTGPAVADIPLLFETGREAAFDRIVVVACAPGEQARRLMARDGFDEAEARRRLAAQQPVEEKAARAHHVIRTDGGFEETDRQVDELVAQLRTRRAFR